MRRIAWLLEDLPLITAAAEAGQLSWSTLQTIVPLCHNQNEEEWLARAQRFSARELAAIARQESAGNNDVPTARSTELRILLDQETTSLYGQTARSLCEEFGRRLDGQEIISTLCFERLTGSAFPSDTTRERMRREMARDWQAEEARTAEVGAQAAHLATSAGHPPHSAASAPARFESSPSHLATPPPSGLQGLSSQGSHEVATHSSSQGCTGTDIGSHPSSAARGSYTKPPGFLGSTSPVSPDVDADSGPPAAFPSASPVVFDSPGVPLEDALEDIPPEEPESNPLPDHWAAVSVVESPCPGDSGVTLARPGPSWQNPRLRYNPENRLLTPGQRREILRRDGYECSTPDCPNTLWLSTHHITFYAEGGLIVPENFITVCSACHRNLHNGNLHIERNRHRLRWTDKAGRSLRVFRPESAPEWPDVAQLRIAGPEQGA